MPDERDRMADLIEAIGLERPSRARAAVAVAELRALIREMGFVDCDRHETDIEALRNGVASEG